MLCILKKACFVKIYAMEFNQGIPFFLDQILKKEFLGMSFIRLH